MHGDRSRVGLSEVCGLYIQTVGRPCEVGCSQLRIWMIDGLLGELEPVRADNGRWSVLRSKIPVLETIVPSLIARSDRRMRHLPI
jgi:hypothetical protein